MATHSESDLQFEIGHVLFIDIAGYSKLLINEQSDLIRQLKEVVRETEQFRIAEAEGKLLRLPTGDGGALVFRNTQEAPVLCALEISKALKNHPQLRVRMGIHSGPVNEVADLNEQMNVAGAGINIAQRVMDCGDAGHILLSKHVAEDLEDYARWRPCLHELGECETKHGGVISVVNLYDDEVGNPHLPEKLREAQREHAAKAAATRPAPTFRRKHVLIAAGVLLIAACGIGFWIYSRQATVTPSGKSIAVLPFENLSRDPDNAYFADGIQDEILTKLAGISDLKVISRKSTAKYKSTPEDLKTVARELGVGTVLEGSVQRAGDKVRVNVQLLDAHADTHLWAKSYDRDLKDVFTVESEVAQEIADTLRVKLSPSQSDALATAPTRDTEAYDLFLKGEYEQRQAESALTPELLDRAEVFYRQALARDPSFALAFARLAYNELFRHWFISNLTSEELAKVKPYIDRALAIAPALPDAHLALGLFYYWGHRDYDPALREIDRAIELQPSSSDGWNIRASIHRRRGEWQRALGEFERAAELNPRDSGHPAEIGATYGALRRWSDAEQKLTHALALDPHSALAARFLARTYINSTGDIRSARRAFDGVPADSRLNVNPNERGAIAVMVDERVYLDVIEKHFSDALKAWDTPPSDTPEAHLRQLEARVGIEVLAGQGAVAKSECEQTRALLEARLAERPEDRISLTALAWVYVCLGRNADALRVSRRAADLLPVEKDAVAGPFFLAGLAQIEASTGQPKEAIKILRQLITAPAGGVVSIARLKIDPVWDPIRNDPDFQKLISEPEPTTIYK
jgi:TolB-like protein/class 3 adenylate cyclase/cytochrome c-type biogenesis protein CcmH/NrfG